MKYTVVHSNDPYLLARLATDLQMEGYESRSEYQHWTSPFNEDYEWLSISTTTNFHNHSCITPDARHELTSRNYIKVLTQILEP